LQTPAWQQALSQASHDLESLLAYLKLEHVPLPAERRAVRQFSLRVPKAFADLMRPGDLNDPLLRQVLPVADEAAELPGFNVNPVGDREAEATPGLLHKYPGRALIVATGACAVHCRYCFRRHYPYASGSASPRQWDGILTYLQAHTEIEEIILSGGDPLMVSDERLMGWLERLAGLPHIKRLRLHTRLPVVVPERITPALTELLAWDRFQTLVVIHANHGNELSPSVANALSSLRALDITLLNQSVLLKGVNDDPAILAGLSHRLFEVGVLPYYLHLLDRVAGAAHFEVGEQRAKDLMATLRSSLPGYLVPKLVREISGEKSKTPIT
jgi:EF-P beta-lysylation protein EpmB